MTTRSRQQQSLKLPESRLSAPAVTGVKANVCVSPLPVIEIRCLVASGSADAIVVK
jgi:hypothetical protein